MYLCPYCDEHIQNKNIDKSSASAICPGCHRLSSLYFHENNNGDITVRPEVEMPNGIKIIKNSSHLILKRKWYHYSFIITLLISLLIMSGSIFWIIFSYKFSGFSLDFNTIYPLVTFIMGIIAFYYSIAGVINYTLIKVNKKSLNFKFLPLPWFSKIKGVPGSNHEIKSSKLIQLYVKEQRTYPDDPKTAQYNIFIITKENKHIELLHGIMTKDQALYIEQELEKFLSIKNVPLKNEVEY